MKVYALKEKEGDFLVKKMVTTLGFGIWAFDSSIASHMHNCMILGKLAKVSELKFPLHEKKYIKSTFFLELCYGLNVCISHNMHMLKSQTPMWYK